jgi:predicted transcriptional regulator
VKVSADTIVSIEITDQDNPWELAKHLQSQYNLSNETTQSLFEMLQKNFETEYVRIMQARSELAQDMSQKRHSVIDE